MKPYRRKLGLFVEKHVLPWKFELGVIVVALLLGTFVVTTYAHAQELEPNVEPCDINLTTGENCRGDKVFLWNEQGAASEASAYADNVAHPDQSWGVNATVPAEAWNQLAPEDIQHFMIRARTDPYGALREILQKMNLDAETQKCTWYVKSGDLTLSAEKDCGDDMLSVSGGASMAGFGISHTPTGDARRLEAPPVLAEAETCTLWRPVVMFSKPPKGWVPYKGGYTHPSCVPSNVHIPPLSPHNHLPCSDSVSAGASRLDLDKDKDEEQEEVYDLDCGSDRIRLEQQGDPRDVLHTELRRMGYHVFQDNDGVWYTAKTDMYVGGKVLTCVGPIDSHKTDCREWVAINDKDRIRACTIHGNIDTSCLSRTVVYDYLMMQQWINGTDRDHPVHSGMAWVSSFLLLIFVGVVGFHISQSLRRRNLVVKPRKKG